MQVAVSNAVFSADSTVAHWPPEHTAGRTMVPDVIATASRVSALPRNVSEPRTVTFRPEASTVGHCAFTDESALAMQPPA